MIISDLNYINVAEEASIQGGSIKPAKPGFALAIGINSAEAGGPKYAIAVTGSKTTAVSLPGAAYASSFGGSLSVAG